MACQRCFEAWCHISESPNKAWIGRFGIDSVLIQAPSYKLELLSVVRSSSGGTFQPHFPSTLVVFHHCPLFGCCWCWWISLWRHRCVRGMWNNLMPLSYMVVHVVTWVFLHGEEGCSMRVWWHFGFHHQGAAGSSDLCVAPNLGRLMECWQKLCAHSLCYNNAPHTCNVGVSHSHHVTFLPAHVHPRYWCVWKNKNSRLGSICTHSECIQSYNSRYKNTFGIGVGDSCLRLVNIMANLTARGDELEFFTHGAHPFLNKRMTQYTMTRRPIRNKKDGNLPHTFHCKMWTWNTDLDKIWHNWCQRTDCSSTWE